MLLTHPFPPLYDANSRILILGSFPSVKSREQNFFYGHPQNRFWPLIARICEEEIPVTIDQKRKLALSHHIALWDVIAQCEITGSSDSSIKNAKVNDFRQILREAGIQKIFVNGGTAYRLYQKYAQEITGMAAVKLPSTSPANAAFRMERLLEEWKIVKAYI